jgi:hypothetical protein
LKLDLESTDKFVPLKAGGRARVWRGRTPGGLEVFALITSVACARTADNRELAAELEEIDDPRAFAPRAIDPRLVI